MIAVTGAGGFIGTALCSAFVCTGTRVREVRRSGGPPPVAGLERAEVSGLERSELARAFAGADTVVHLAGRTHRLGRDAGDSPPSFLRANVDGTRAVIEAAADAGVPRVLVASSVKAVGESNRLPWTEETRPAPRDPYGVSKLESERVALATGAERGVEIVVMRFPLVYGPGAPANVLRLVSLVARGVPLPFGGIGNRRSMLSTGNLLGAVRALADTPGLAGEVFFVADGVDTSTPELIGMIADGLGQQPRLFRAPPGLLAAFGRVGDAISRVVQCPVTSADVERLTGSLMVSTAKLAHRTGYRPPEAPRDGWRGVAQWFRQSRR